MNDYNQWFQKEKKKKSLQEMTKQTQLIMCQMERVKIVHCFRKIVHENWNQSKTNWRPTPKWKKNRKKNRIGMDMGTPSSWWNSITIELSNREFDSNRKPKVAKKKFIIVITNAKKLRKKREREKNITKDFIHMDYQELQRAECIFIEFR